MKSRKHWIPLNSLYNEIDRRMKEAILKLENNKTISTKDIKCPVCGGLMEVDHSEINSYDKSSIYLEHLHECCHLEMKHYIENILF